MKLLFKQRFFSWLDSYDVYDEQGLTLFSVEGKLGWGHRLHILDASSRFVGEVKEVVLTLLPRFELYLGETCVGSIQKEFSLFKPRFSMDVNGWSIRGDWLEWDYEICDSRGNIVATVSKQLFNWTDTYVIDVAQPSDALAALMVTLAIDAEKCSRD